jgi:hypothetical protein
MKTKPNVTVYTCDHCKKKLFVKSAMERHEERCGANPANFRPCMNCAQLEQKEIEFYTGSDRYDDGEPIYRTAKTFYCAAKKILMLHPKTAYLTGRQNLSWVQLEDEETEQFEMPTECEIFDDFTKSFCDKF